MAWTNTKIGQRCLWTAIALLALANGYFGYKHVTPKFVPQFAPHLVQPTGGGASTVPNVYNAVATGGCDNTGATDTTAALQSALTAARAAKQPLYLPSGTYKVNLPTGKLFDMTGDKDHVFGDGMLASSASNGAASNQATIIKQADNLILTGNTTYFKPSARGQRIHDLTIQGGANPTGVSVSGTPTVVAAGNGYNVGDTITIAIPGGGYYQNQAVVLNVATLTGGAGTGVATVTVNTAGSWSGPYTATVSQASTSGSGSGATFTLTFTSGFGQAGVDYASGAFQGVCERVEVVGLYGGNNAGGTGLGAEAVFNQYEYTPQLGTTVSAGAIATVTPSSINGCSVGRRIEVDTAITAPSGGSAQPSRKQCALSAQTSAPGTGYLVGDTVTTGGDTGTEAVFYIGTLRTVSVASIVAGGSGYANNDLIVVNGGTIGLGPLGAQTVLKVTNASGGVIQAGGLSINSAGCYSTTPGAGTLTTTAQTGSGTGATVTLTYSMDQVGSLTANGVSSIAAGGSGYVKGDFLIVSGGTFGVPAIYLVKTVNGSGGVTGVSQIVGGTYSVAPGAGAATTAYNPTTGAASAGTSCTLTLNALIFQNGTPVSCGNISAAANNPNTVSTSGSGTSGTINVYWGVENIAVLGNTPTTFTSYFQNAHNSSVYIGVLDRGTGEQTVFRDCYVHDCWSCTGIGGTGKGVLFDNIRVVNCGIGNVGVPNQGTQHGVYWQGSNTEFRRLQIEGSGGYSIQLQESQPNGDASGNKVISCVSINPVLGHLVVNQADSPNQLSSLNNYQVNLDVPLGDVLNRFCTIQGCTFKCTNQNITQPTGGVTLAAPCSFVGNTLEDANGLLTSAGQAWVSVTAADVNIIGNQFRMVNAIFTTYIIQSLSPRTLVGNNTFVNMRGSVQPFDMNAYNICRGNTVYLGTDFTGTVFNIPNSSPGCDVVGNEIYGPNTASSSAVGFGFGALATAWRIHDNYANIPAGYATGQMASGNSGSFYGNDWTNTLGARVSGATANTNIQWYNNDGAISSGGTTRAALTRSAGRLLNVQTGTGGSTVNKLMKYDGSGNVILCGTSDTSCAGIAASTNNASLWVVLAGQAGTQYPSVLIEAAGGVTAGNLCIMSTTTAATIHDTGSQVTIPASGFLCRALTSAAANGNVQVEVIRLQGIPWWTLFAVIPLYYMRRRRLRA